MKDRYEFADKAVAELNKEFIRQFEPMRSVLKIDELNIMNSAKLLYEKLLKIVIEVYLEIALRAYNREAEVKKTSIDEDWLFELLFEYDPITRYMFMSEVERKRQRFAESLIASTNKSEAVDTALCLWSKMIAQYAIEVTDKAVEQAFIDNDVQRVRWITEEDNRVCSICAGREGKIYNLKDLPPKPHIGSRCTTTPVGR
jgi:SPP1 gp7 family putative phage head morphogenesis protein